MNTIMVVDDIKENIDVMKGLLRKDYKITFAVNGEMALENAATNRPDLILLDVMMPDMDGYEVCRKLKQNPVTNNIPVIFVSAKDQEIDEALGFDAGCADYIVKPVSPVLVKARIKTHLALSNQKEELNRRIKETTRELHDTRLQIIYKLGRASEYKDNETGLHIERMSRYCYFLALKMGMPEEDADLLRTAAPMHDIGKIGIDDAILKKPGKLTDTEWLQMKSHPHIGEDILTGHESRLLKTAAIVALQHHEKWNGTGYPMGLKENEINLFARIAALADVFDALTSKRPYKEAWNNETAFSYIMGQSGIHFDPVVCKAFKECYRDILEVQDEFPEN